MLLSPSAGGGITRIVVALVVLGTMLAGCAPQFAKPSAGESARASAAQGLEPAPVPGQSVSTSQAQLPVQDLTESILYEFLLAEIAGQRGNLALAAQAYVDLAKRTHDPRIARRATEMAVFARMNSTAIEAARLWRETEPGSVRALQVVAGLLINANRLDEAFPYLQEMLAVQGEGNAASSFLQLGSMLGNTQDAGATLKLVQRLAEGYAQLPQAHYVVAQAASRAGDVDLAIAETRNAQQLRPDWEPAVLLEAQLLQRTSMADALARLGRYLDTYPKSREVRLYYARALVTEKRFPEARAEFQKLLANFPADTEVVYAVALLSLQLNDYANAETNLRRLLELDYRDKDGVRLYLGQIAEEQNKFDEALRWYREVGPGPQYVAGQIRYAVVLSKQGRVDDALDYLRKIEPSGAQSRVQVTLAEGQVLREAGREHEAFQVLGKALALQPDQPDLLYDYAMLAEKVDRIDLLETNLRKLIALRPDNAHAYNALGYSLADRNLRLPEARELIETAIKLSPQDTFIIDSMGWVLYRLGNLPEALKYLRRAFADRPDPEIGAHLGEVLWMSGDRGEAEKVWDEASQKNPKNDTLLNTIKRFKQK